MKRAAFNVTSFAIVCFGLAAGCSDDTSDGNGPAGPKQPAAFNGNCSSARWANVSEQCWSCLCGACKAQMDACNEHCTGILECVIEKQTFVNVASEIPCEIRATAVECLKTPESQAAAQPLITLDNCLIGAPKSAGFRVCESECQIPYPGDVCQRYP